MRSKLQQCLVDENGTAAIEFTLIAAGLSVAVITLTGQLGDQIQVVTEHFRDMLMSVSLHYGF